jgi:hypothetical protein
MAAVGDDKHTEILDIIEKRLIPDEAAKKARGEVFTPLNLVREMLYGLRKSDHTQIWGMRDGVLFDDDPEDRIGGIPLDVWRNPESKWLDPANGIGNFPFVAFLMLDFQLSKSMKDATARNKHIVEKMLFMIEIDKGNVNTARKIFETLAPGAKSNVCCADTLKLKKEDLVREFGVAEFDVVMGNPPFQDNISMNGTLWDKFIMYSFTLLKAGGYLVFVHPSGWRNVDGKFKYIQKELLNRDIQYLEIHNEKDGVKMFKSETRYDWYVLKNSKYGGKTVIYGQDRTFHKIDISEFEFIPNEKFELIKKLSAGPDDETANVMYSRSAYGTDKKWISKIRTEVYRFPCIYTVTSKSVPSLRWSSTNENGHFGIPKLVWSNGRITSVGSFIDKTGEYGLTQFSYAIADDPDKLESIKTAFDTPSFRNLMEACAVGQLSINFRVLKTFKKDFYKEFLPKKSVSKAQRTRTKARRSRQRAR